MIPALFMFDRQFRLRICRYLLDPPCKNRTFALSKSHFFLPPPSMARHTVLLLLLLVGASATPDMSIINYDREHGVPGLERSEEEVRRMYDAWTAAQRAGREGAPIRGLP